MDFDWKLCIICQTDTTETLKCPMKSKSGTTDEKKEVYRAFLKNVAEFKEIGALPEKLKFGDDETADSFADHNACWHKSCHLKFANSKLKNAQQTAKRRRQFDPEESPQKKPTKRRSLDQQMCIFCEKGKEEGDLHEFCTFDADKNVRTIATELQETKLLSKLAGGDLIAIEAKYHLKCLVGLRTRYRSFLRKTKKNLPNTEEKMKESIAFVELTNYMERSVDCGTLLFRLSELYTMYTDRLQNLGVRKSVHRTRFKQIMLDQFPEAQEQQEGKNIVIVFKEGMRNMLREALKQRDFSEDAKVLAKAAKIIRKDIFDHEGFKFTGSFTQHCQEDSVPISLKSLVSMILNGTDLDEQERHESQASLTIAQTMIFNTKKRVSDHDVQTRHTLLREPPLPIYLGLNIHAVSRSKKLIQMLYKMGITISYDRIMSLEDWLATSVSERFKEDDVVSPACLRKGLFTVGALDNLDHNPSSTTSMSSFHGTCISLFQFPTRGNAGEYRAPIAIPPSGASKHILPGNYASVPAVALKTSNTCVPSCQMVPVEICLDKAITQEDSWVKQALGLLQKKELSNEDSLAWAAYHASLQSQAKDPLALCALLPLFYDKAATPAMVKHGMHVQKLATDFLNPGQIPVTTFDQPLFAIAKYVQWNWPETHGEKVHVVMLGGLHTEMALWSTLGDILQASGWTTAITEAEVASSGTADSYLKASHLTRTRHAHQVTLLTLELLQQEAFLHSDGPHDEAQKCVWRDTMKEKSPTFMYWDLIRRYEALILIFVRAHREKNFTLYVSVLEELVPLFFALDHVNYARWMPIHIRDMKSLPPRIKEEFEKQQHWVLSKTNNRFSAIPIDQAHEQENKTVKSSGGAVGLTENPVAFRRWMLSGPELARLMKQFESQYVPDEDPDNPHNFQHHEQGLATQKTFQRQVNSLADTFRRMGNPFLDDFPDLVTLDDRKCVHDSVVDSVRNLEDTGRRQYLEFVAKVIVERTESIHTSIKRNSLPLFKNPKVKIVSKQGQKIKALENNVALFGQLYISMQNRESDLQEFFGHEVQSFPPSLSDFGKLHLPGTKSDLLKCLEQPALPDPPTKFDCRVLDGAAIVHCLPATGTTTFADYASSVFIPFLDQQFKTTDRLDVVWDTYDSDSLKESTREKRGKGVRRKVSGQAKVPGNWMDFLRVSQNKEELFSFLTSQVAEYDIPPGKELYITSGKSVVAIGSSSTMPDCNHEEADTRMVVHVLHALQQGSTTIQIRTVDTDVVVILIGKYHDLAKLKPGIDIWIAFGTGRNFCFYSINRICSSLGEQRSRSLPVFHSYTGCDTTSAFHGKGKKSAWQAWASCEEVTDTLEQLACHPFQLLHPDSLHFSQLERFTVVLYDKTSPSTSINDVRMDLFCHKNIVMDKLPPTKDALLQHARRAVFQAGIWSLSDLAQMEVPSPQSYGWKKDDNKWVPVWITIPEVSSACQQLVKCNCKGDCSHCKCGKANLDCTPLCKCSCKK